MSADFKAMIRPQEVREDPKGSNLGRGAVQDGHLAVWWHHRGWSPWPWAAALWFTALLPVGSTLWGLAASFPVA